MCCVVVDGEQRGKGRERRVKAAKFGRKCNGPSRIGDKQRLDPESVPTDDDSASPTIVNRKCPHADQMLLDMFGVGFVESEDDFGVTSCATTDTALLQCTTKCRRVVYLTVVNDDDRLILVEHRLMAMVNVDDGQPSHAECRVRMRHNASAIGPAMSDSRSHAGYQILAQLQRRFQSDETNYAAHSYANLLLGEPLRFAALICRGVEQGRDDKQIDKVAESHE